MKKKIKSIFLVCMLLLLVSVFCVQSFGLTKEEYASKIHAWNVYNQFDADAVIEASYPYVSERPYVQSAFDYAWPYGVVRIVVPAGYEGVCWVSSGAPLKELCPYMVAGRYYTISVLCNGVPAEIDGVMFHNGSEDGWWGYNRSGTRLITQEELNSFIYFYPCLKVDTSFVEDTVFELTIFINEGSEPCMYSAFVHTEVAVATYEKAYAQGHAEGHAEGYKKGKEVGYAETPTGQADIVTGMLDGVWTNVKGCWDILTGMELPFTSLTIGGIVSTVVVAAVVAWIIKTVRGK